MIENTQWEKTMKKILIAAALLFAVTLNADNEKEQLITPTLWTLAPDMFACNLTNVDSKAHRVEVRIISNGKVLLESKPMTLEPRHTSNHKVEGPAKGGPLYCEFTVEGDKDEFRGVAVIYHAPAGSDGVAIAAE
jgi:hypothetical protein